MILRAETSFRQNVPPVSTAPPAAVPAWLRRAPLDAQDLAAQGVEDLAFIAGAAIGALDTVVRRQERWAGAWRQRLALRSAAVSVRQAGRVEDEVALRDAILLTRPSDDVGPGGRMLLAWRRLAARPAGELLSAENLAAVVEEFGGARDDAAARDLADDLRQVATSQAPVWGLTGALAGTQRVGAGWMMGAWLADALLAQRLGWDHAIPLLGSEQSRAAGAGRPRRPTVGSATTSNDIGADAVKSLLAAQARAALRAIDLSVELERRAERLLAVAPRLRARASDSVVERLLCDDAMVASAKIAGMSDRGLRRLFERLVDLGAVRELSGRATFRIYGL